MWRDAATSSSSRALARSKCAGCLRARPQGSRMSYSQPGSPDTHQLARRTADRETREHQAAACHKDIGAARDLAASLGIDLPLADLVLAHVDDIYRLGPGSD